MENTADFFQEDLNGVRVWNPMPGEDETALWNGPQENGYAHGYGQLTWYYKGREISVYKGDMNMGKPHGKGRYLFADGDIYDGSWKDGNRHGYGKQWFKDGRYYEGNWTEDKISDV